MSPEEMGYALMTLYFGSIARIVNCLDGSGGFGTCSTLSKSVTGGACVVSGGSRYTPCGFVVSVLADNKTLDRTMPGKQLCGE